MEYLKKAPKRAATGERDVRDKVQAILDAIEAGGEDAARRDAEDFDRWDGDIVVTADARARAADAVSQKLKDDILFAHDNVRRFAESQKATMVDSEIEVVPGLVAGQKQIPVSAAGCYAPGGRYAHVASAVMSITAKYSS